MAASDFTLKPVWVKPVKREFHNIETKTESFKKHRMNISSLPTKIWKLKFEGMSDADYATLLAHYDARLGGYGSFSWQSVPSYIDSGTNKTGHWVDGSLKPDPAAKFWDVEIQFEEDV